MIWENYYAKFLAIYEECYDDIVKMMRSKGITHLEAPCDENYGYEKITIINEYYGNSEDQEVAVVELIGNDLYFENGNGHSYEVSYCVMGHNIVDLYDIVYRVLYRNN